MSIQEVAQWCLLFVTFVTITTAGAAVAGRLRRK